MSSKKFNIEIEIKFSIEGLEDNSEEIPQETEPKN